MEEMDLPPNVTPKMIHQFTSISLRKVYELLNTNPEYGGIPCFRIGPKNIIADRIEFLGWWTSQKQKGRQSFVK